MHKWAMEDSQPLITENVQAHKSYAFTCVRNPYTRILSSFFDKICGIQRNGNRYRGRFLAPLLARYGVTVEGEFDQIAMFRRFLLFARDTIRYRKPMDPDIHWSACAGHVSTLISGGGRYDDLVKRFTGQQIPATGVSIGVDRLLAALHAKGRLDTQSAGPVVVTVMDRDRMSDYQAMVADLRNAGIRSEVYLGNPKNFGNQLRYADKRDSPAAVIAGSDEFDRNAVQIKDLILGAKIAATASLEEWKDLLGWAA